jgi:riboflavin-specific deaminase-like protein
LTTRPYVLLSCAMSIDGYIDDTTPQRLILSNQADLDRVDAVRAECDAILIGAETMRRDNPRLLVNSEERRAARESRGLPAFPLKVTMTRSGNLDPSLRFWHFGGAKLVYCPEQVAGKVREQLNGLADVCGLAGGVDVEPMLSDLWSRGVRRLMVEGGGTIHTQFLEADTVDEIQLAVAPFFLGDPSAPSFVNAGTFADGPRRRMELAEVLAVGDVAVLRYLTSRELPALALASEGA